MQQERQTAVTGLIVFALIGAIASIALPGKSSKQANQGMEEQVLAMNTSGASAKPVRLGKVPKLKQGRPIAPKFLKVITPPDLDLNNSNPTWSLDGNYLGYEKHDQKDKELVITDSKGNVVQTVAYKAEGDDLGLSLLLPGIADQGRYNAGLTWSLPFTPQPDPVELEKAKKELAEGKIQTMPPAPVPVHRFIYMSNGSEGNYDLYLGNVGSEENVRLTDHPEKDGHAHWSPKNDQVLFVSGRSGKADIYLFDIASKETRKMTNGVKSFLYPQWSPDGTKAVMIYGSNENHDIYIMDDFSKEPKKNVRPLNNWSYDDLRPMWSPDGEKIAFYTNYNVGNDPKEWALVVLEIEKFNEEPLYDLTPYIVATDVIPDIEKGPAWMPDSKNLIYVKKDREKYNPIHVVDYKDRVDRMVQTDTRINHDLSASKDGTIAFRSQVETWDQIFLVKF
ncbi:MAG: DPP IV N-terminal domain-containing protein [Gammaproteobacteria bacterium]|nr:DPP IV N-terminal domain-containing protein [Gammaproteobacteria bacterium]MDH5693717.1 DPP IV N-terminal domain-containing protein [Gammaproteobacteria bacterium]